MKTQKTKLEKVQKVLNIKEMMKIRGGTTPPTRDGVPE